MNPRMQTATAIDISLSLIILGLEFKLPLQLILLLPRWILLLPLGYRVKTDTANDIALIAIDFTLAFWVLNENSHCD